MFEIFLFVEYCLKVFFGEKAFFHEYLAEPVCFDPPLRFCPDDVPVYDQKFHFIQPAFECQHAGLALEKNQLQYVCKAEILERSF